MVNAPEAESDAKIVTDKIGRNTLFNEVNTGGHEVVPLEYHREVLPVVQHFCMLSSKQRPNPLLGRCGG